MPVPEINPKIEHTVLEKDIERLTVEIRAEKQPERVKEALKEAMARKIYPEKIEEAPIKEKGGEAPPAGGSSVLPGYLQSSSKEIKLQVEKLLDFAWHHGIDSAVKEARKFGPFILDAFHDALTDKLYEEFQKRGIIK
jgi:hypothetical protein